MTDWSGLLGDVEAQAESLAEREREGQAQERTRVERARVTLTERLTAALGDQVQLTLGPAGVIRGRVEALGPDWLLLGDTAAGHEHLVLLSAVTVLVDLTPDARQVDSSPVLDRLDAAWALRRLARDRARVRIRTRDGEAYGGLLEVVGADHLDLVDDLLGAARGGPRRATTLPFSAVAVVSRT